MLTECCLLVRSNMLLAESKIVTVINKYTHGKLMIKEGQQLNCNLVNLNASYISCEIFI